MKRMENPTKVWIFCVLLFIIVVGIGMYFAVSDITNKHGDLANTESSTEISNADSRVTVKTVEPLKKGDDRFCNMDEFKAKVDEKYRKCFDESIKDNLLGLFPDLKFTEYDSKTHYIIAKSEKEATTIVFDFDNKANAYYYSITK